MYFCVALLIILKGVTVCGEAFFAVNGNKMHAMVPNNKIELDYDAGFTYEYNYTEGQLIKLQPLNAFKINNATVVQNGKILFFFNDLRLLIINTNYIKGVFWMYFTVKDNYYRFYAVKLKLSPLLDPIKLKITDDHIVLNSEKRVGNVYDYYYSSERDGYQRVKCEKRCSDSLILKFVDECGNRIQGKNEIEIDIKLKPYHEFTKIKCILQDDKQNVVEEHNLFYNFKPEYKEELFMPPLSWNTTIYIANSEVALSYEENEIINLYCLSTNVSRKTCSIAWLFRDKVISGSTFTDENKCINSQDFVLTKEDNDTTIICFNNETDFSLSVKLFMNYPNYLDTVSVSAHWLWVAVPIALTILVARKCFHWKRNKTSPEVGNGGALTGEHIYEETPDTTYNVVYDHRQ